MLSDRRKWRKCKYGVMMDDRRKWKCICGLMLDDREGTGGNADKRVLLSDKKMEEVQMWSNGGWHKKLEEEKIWSYVA